MKTIILPRVAISASFALLVSSAHAQPGSLDITFNPGSGANGAINCMALETNGQIVIGGNFTTFNGANQNYLARLNSDGSLDSSFYAGVGPTAFSPSPPVAALAVQPDGEILVGGYFDNWNQVSWNQPICLRTDGSVDTSFNTSGGNGGGVPNGGGTVLRILQQTDGKILIAGNFFTVSIGNGHNTNFNNIARLNTNGTLDVTFNPGTGPNDPVSALGLQSSGQIIIGGTFTTINNSDFNSLARLNSDGSVDSTFNALLQDGSVQTLAVTPQDQIVIGGSFTSINGYSRESIARLNADGSLDTSFAPGMGANGSVSGVVLQPNGEVIVSGDFTTFNNVAVGGGLARLNTNGTLDVSFNVGTGVYYPPSLMCMASQPDGRILIAGSFTSFNGTNINSIARLIGEGPIPALPILLNPQLYFGMNLSGTVSNMYLIEWTTNLATPSLWTPLFDVTLQTSSQFILDPTAAAGNRFYRAVQIAP